MCKQSKDFFISLPQLLNLRLRPNPPICSVRQGTLRNLLAAQPTMTVLNRYVTVPPNYEDSLGLLQSRNFAQSLQRWLPHDGHLE